MNKLTRRKLCAGGWYDYDDGDGRVEEGFELWGGFWWGDVWLQNINS